MDGWHTPFDLFHYYGDKDCVTSTTLYDTLLVLIENKNEKNCVSIFRKNTAVFEH